MAKEARDREREGVRKDNAMGSNSRPLVEGATYHHEGKSKEVIEAARSTLASE